ncbi:MAG: efflux RND transporter periplasmic adaptor subunit, partial [Azospirillum sp.]|nr:efflux RND transporter periplasmic adaptor subunit [Azospirillum sp.]
ARPDETRRSPEPEGDGDRRKQIGRNQTRRPGHHRPAHPDPGHPIPGRPIPGRTAVTRSGSRHRLGLIALVLAGAAGCAAPARSADSGPDPAAGQGFRARALIKAHHEATLSSEIAGRIVKMPRREGETFKKNDRLVEFDCNWFVANQAASRANLRHAQARLDGLEALLARRSTGTLDVALARADVDKARAELQSTALTVERCVIGAPFSGRVVELKAHPFESVAQGAPLLTILDDGEPDVAMVVPASWLTWLHPEQSFSLAIDETLGSHAGKITRIGAQIDPVSQTVTVYGTVSNTAQDLVPGMSGTASFAQPGVSSPGHTQP